MEVTKPKASTKAQANVQTSKRFLKEHHHCSICDAEFEIFHEINQDAHNVKEEAYCNQCGIRARSTAHTIQ